MTPVGSSITSRPKARRQPPTRAAITRISIALATYNGERFIAEQLESLAGQTRPPFELVVCDDGSTDATLRIVEDFARTAPFPVRIFRNEQNLGYADNFLKAASLCEGDWIAFCDQDDYWLPSKLETVAGAIAAHPGVILVTHPAALVDQDLRPTGKIAWPSRERTFRRLIRSPWRSGMGCGQVFHASLVRQIPWRRRFRSRFEGRRHSAHDEWIVQLSQCVGDARYLSEPLILRRRHQQSVTAEQGPPTKAAKSRPVGHDVTDELQLLSDLASDRADVLLACASEAPEPFSTRLKDAASYFTKARQVLERRSAWRGRRGWARYRAATSLFVDPGYWAMGDGVVGWRGVARDLVDLTARGA